MDWQPIETAPKDGTAILVVRVLPVGAIGMQVSSWEIPKPQIDGYRINNGEPCWLSYSREKRVPEPTHWMPLPAPPEPA